MDVIYFGAHSIDITVNGDRSYNTWTDFHLIPTSKPIVSQASPNLNIVQVPTINYFVDLSEIQNGGLTFGQRSGEWEFIIDHNQWSSWLTAYNTIKQKLHGKSVIVKLTDVPETDYYGRIYVSKYSPGSEYTTISISYIFNSNSELAVTYPDIDTDSPYYSGGGSGGGSSGGGSSSSESSDSPVYRPTEAEIQSFVNDVKSSSNITVLNYGYWVPTKSNMYLRAQVSESPNTYKSYYYDSNSYTSIPKKYYENTGNYGVTVSGRINKNGTNYCIIAKQNGSSSTSSYISHSLRNGYVNFYMGYSTSSDNVVAYIGCETIESEGVIYAIGYSN